MGDNSRLPNLTNEQEKFFLETCIEETIRVGYMGISLQRESWAILGKKLFEAYGITSNQKQLKNKYDYMRGKYLAWSYLRRKTGNIYNPHTNMFNLTSQEWDDVCKVHPKAKYLKTAPLTNHELCATLFDKSSATGIIRRSVAPRKASSSSQNSSVRTLQIEDAPIESKDDENTYDEGTHETGYETGYETGFEGVLSLEEIDESEYGLELPKGFYKGGKKNEKVAKGKRKREEGKGDEAVVEEDKEGEIFEEVKKDDMKKKKKKNKKKKKKKDKEPKESVDNEAEAVTDTVADEDDKREAEEEEEQPDDSEYHAWYELRLHPLLMKSISRLKFKEPTPIQKVCIPAGAHQGKDVSGAAETGSGKTLAFGLPILQRLLEEREKFERQLEEKGDADEKVVSKGLLRALIITPTRELALQVTDHLKQVAIGTDVRVVPIVGGMSTEKQERLLKGRPEVVVGTPGRLWELMSGGEVHLVELHSLSFFVLDEADRMIDNGHFHELQSIIDMLPMIREGHAGDTENCVTASGFQRKKRQTFVFSATIALSFDFRKKLKRGSVKAKLDGELNSIEALSERAGMRSNAAIIDLTNASIMPNKLEESFIECKEEDKDACLYYILSVHGHGRTIVFCTSIAALRHISSLMKILNVNVWTLHAQMQQRARLKAIDRFRGHDHGILVATDVAARGLDIPGVRTVVHYQLPHSAEVYVHRSGRTARASADGCSIALISPKEASKFTSLCKSFSKESFKQFPIQASYMPEVLKRLSLARQIDRVLRKESQDKADKSWFQRNAESIDLIVEENDSEDERVNSIRKKKSSSAQLKNLQQELKSLVSRPLQPKSFSSRYLAGAGISLLLQQQFEELGRQKRGDSANQGDNKRRMVVIGQDCVEPLTALRISGQEISMDTKAAVEKRRNLDNLRRKRKEDKKRLHDQKRKQRKKLKAGGD